MESHGFEPTKACHYCQLVIRSRSTKTLSTLGQLNKNFTGAITIVAIVLESNNNSYTCKLHV